MSRNPYPNRPYPVGDLEYKLEPERAAKMADLKGKHISMLEYGEAEVMFDMPRIVGKQFKEPYVNLGHAMGGSAFLLAKGLEDQDMHNGVFSVDKFEYFRDHKSKAEAELHKRELSHVIELYDGDTTEWAIEFMNRGCFFSFVFIDADHSYEGVKKDFVHYSPLIVHGGVVAFHDTNQEPSHRVIEWYVTSEWQQILHVNRIKAFRKV